VPNYPYRSALEPGQKQGKKKERKQDKREIIYPLLKATMVQFTVFKGSKEGKVIQSTTTKDIRENEVLIRVTHSGLCGTDEHKKSLDMVIGHEGAGVVEVSSPGTLPERSR
jgi:hypothetical protein